MPAGRPPKPTALKQLQGTYRKDRANRNEPQPTVGTPECPDWMSAAGRQEWARIVPELERMGVLTIVDGAALEAYCSAYARWIEAEEKIREFGTVIRNPSGRFVQSPYLSIAMESMRLLRMFMSEFGLSPATRSRINAPAPAKPMSGGWADIVNLKSIKGGIN